MNAPAPPPEIVGPRRRFRPLRWLVGAIAAIVFAIGVGFWSIDTGPGHRFLVDRIAELPIRTGLRIRIGRIDGSIWGRATLRDLRLYDPKGLFFEAPEVTIDWRPLAWLANKLDIRSLDSDLVILHRMPQLRKTKQGPILPGFDLLIGRADIGRVQVEPGVLGARRVGRLHARSDIRAGRALIDLRLAMNGGGDRIAVLLDAEPDRDRFDLEARVAAPANSLLGRIVGTARPIALTVTGAGGWTVWNGAAKMQLSGRPTVDLALGVRGGRYLLSGWMAPSQFLQGKLQRLSAPRVAVRGAATLADRRLDSQLRLATPSLRIDGRGIVDLADSSFDPVTIDAHLLRPPALFPNMTGRDVRLRVRLQGPFATARFGYQLAAPRVAFDQTGFEEVRATGEGRLSRAPVTVPIRLHARRVTGVGDVAGGILADLDVAGQLGVTAKELRGEGLALRSDKLSGKLSLLVDLVTGNYDVTLSGQLARYLIPGLGIVDVLSDLKVVPDPSGRGTRVEGRGRAWVRRFDNAFLRSLAGGLPQIDTRLVRTRDGVLQLVGLKLTAPSLSITGNGMRRRDGTFQFSGAGAQASYGPLTLALDGDISRPKLDILLARPVEALGLSQVRLLLDPTPEGYAYRAAGGSTLGPFASRGAVLLPSGQAATVAVAALDVSGTHATGQLRSDPGGFTGRLGVAGGGIDGELRFAPQGMIQQIEAHLAADGANLAGTVGTSIRRGRIDGTILLDPAGTAVDMTALAQGLRRGTISLARLAGNARLKGGVGQVRASLAGSRGRAFDIQTIADVAPNRFRLFGQGTVDRRPIRLASAAELVREGDGWRLRPTGVEFAGGSAQVSGLFAASATAVDATMAAMPLSVLDMAYPGLGLGGNASGRLTYRFPRDGSAPTGRVDVRIRGLTRSGLVLSSRPIDVGLAGVLTGSGAAARAVMASGGQTIGRAQARVAPLGSGATLLDRMLAAPLTAQLRYSGPADTLWRLTGVETIDLSGPVAVAADLGGRLGDPRIRGSLRTTAARVESAVTGTVISGIAATGSFDGSRLVIDRFTGNTPRDGAVSGRGTFDLAAARGFGIDLALQAENALLIDRDDVSAQVTGPLTIRSDGAGGTIAGDVRLNRSSFRLGRAVSAEAVPQLAVQEVNRPVDEAEERAPSRPWQLDVRADARNRLFVSGLGLDSEWRANLQLKGVVDNPAISGRADLIRGNVEFAGRRFDLDRGAIRFQGEAPPDPVLDIVAQANLQGLNATIRVSGTAQKPEVDFASVPALPEDELLSRLLFGSSITTLSAPEALQLAAAVASLRSGGGTGLNPLNAIRRAAGLDRLRILPADITTGQGTSIAAGKYLGRRTYAEVITDGQGYSATRVEFQLTRWLSLLATVSTIGRHSTNVRVSKDY